MKSVFYGTLAMLKTTWKMDSPDNNQGILKTFPVQA